MPLKILHIISQRPSLTGSGITLDAFVREAEKRGYEQHVICGTPKSDPLPQVGGLPTENIHPLLFESDDLPFPVPGMSDVMPYQSTRFSSMSEAMVDHYTASWNAHIKNVLESFTPDVIHSHHIWLLSSMLRDLALHTPIATQCHATGFRQMVLCPHLKSQVVKGCSRNSAFLALHEEHGEQLADVLDVSAKRVHVIGAGYREDLFFPANQSSTSRDQLLYIGKYSRAKGLPWLLDAVELLWDENPNLVLHVAGSGAGPEAEQLKGRMEQMGERIIVHGQLPQDRLASLMRRCNVCVLPSFYEGLPLVLVEALACGCRLVSTRLPGVVNHLAPHISGMLEMIPLPRLLGADEPALADLPRFVEDLCNVIRTSVRKSPIDTQSIEYKQALAPFTWRAVFNRVESVWQSAVVPR